jgi:hypothetical protein
MDMSWQTTFALICATVVAAVVPGTLGFANARLEAADRHRQEVVRLRAEVQSARKTIQRISTPCTGGNGGTRDEAGTAGVDGSADTTPRSADLEETRRPQDSGGQ